MREGSFKKTLKMAEPKSIETIIDMEDEIDAIIDDVGKRVAETIIEIDLENEEDLDEQTDKDENRDTGGENDDEFQMAVEEQGEPDNEEGEEVGMARWMWNHFKDFLVNTTAHGFNHLVQRREDGTYDKGMIIFWAVAIFVAYFASGYYVVSSVHEAEKTPFATTVDYRLGKVNQLDALSPLAVNAVFSTAKQQAHIDLSVFSRSIFFKKKIPVPGIVKSMVTTTRQQQQCNNNNGNKKGMAIDDHDENNN